MQKVNWLKNQNTISVRFRLVLGLSILAALTVCATVVAAITFLSHRDKLNQVVNTEVPTLLLAAELAHAGEAIASGVAPVATAQSFPEAENVTGEILDKFARMDRLIIDLGRIETDNSRIEIFQNERSNIQENFLQLQANVTTYWHVRSRNKDRRVQFLELLDQWAEKALSQAEKSLQPTGLSRLEQAAALRLSQAIVARSETEISKAQLQLNDLELAVKQMAGSTPSRQLIETSSRIRAFAKTAWVYLSDRAEETALAKKTFALVAYHKHLSDRLTVALSHLLEAHKKAIVTATNEAEKALTISSTLLIILSVLSVVLAVAIALILDKSISGRLRRLQDSMTLIATGERSVEIHENGKDEIGEMGRSLSKFVKTLSHQERSLRRAKNEAVMANRAKSLFLANVSHELRTPLNAILGFSEIIRTGALGKVQPARYGDYANDIHESGQHLLDLINDVLDMAKMEAGKTEVRETAVNFSLVIHESLKIVSQLARETHIRIETEIPHNLPALWADNRMLVQMCTNLTENAVDYSPPGSQITISAHITDLGQFAFSVIDQGMGMSPSEITRALKPLEREDIDVPRETDGTGLGLPLIAQYVFLHEGELTIDSHPGEGTTVNVIFPASRVRPSAERKFTVIDGSA